MLTIAIEGTDAAGKQTQAAMLKDHLENTGLKVKVVSFPRYDTPIGKLIKSALRNEVVMSDMAMHMLLDVDKQDFSDNLLTQELDGFDVIIYDRYTMSNMAYCMAKGIPPDWVINIQSGLVKPDITFILHLPAEVSYERKHSNYSEEDLDKHEKDIDLLKRAETVYTILYALSNNPYNQDIIYLVDANKPKEEVSIDIVKLYEETVASHE